MALVVLSLSGRGPNAVMQQVLPQIELDRRNGDSVCDDSSEIRITPHLTLDSATLQYWRVALSSGGFHG